MLTLLLILIISWTIVGTIVFIIDVGLILPDEEKHDAYYSILILTFIFYLIIGPIILIKYIGLKRLFCILTFGHNLQTYYGYGCRLEDDFLHCCKCGYIPTNQERFYNVPDNLL